MNAWLERLGWMLIHSIWIGALVWLFLQVTLFALAKKSAQIRYLAASLALSAAALGPWLNFAWEDFQARLSEPRMAQSTTVAALVTHLKVSSDKPSPAANILASPSPVIRKEWPDSWSQAMRPYLPKLVLFWLAGVILCSLRFWVSWRAVQNLSRLTLTPLSEEWQQRFERLCKLAGISQLVHLGETLTVNVPMVIGWLKPVILLPMGALTGLSTSQVESILLHELAHIRRHDYLINVLQTVCETIFFYQPAIWAISRRMRMERELACDDQVITWNNDPLEYAEALTAFEGLRGRSLSLAASGEGDLLTRVRRLVLGTEPKPRTASVRTLAGVLGVVIYLLSMVGVPTLSAQVMTAAERIEAIKTTQSQLLQGFPGKPETKIRIYGTYRTGDGKPLPSLKGDSWLSLSYTIKRIGSKCQGGILVQKGSFDTTFDADAIDFHLVASVPGYAPIYLQDLAIHDNTIGPLEIILQHGIPAKLRIISEDGTPMEGVIVDGQIIKDGFPFLSANINPEQRSGPDGMVSLGEVLKDSNLGLTFTKPGGPILSHTFTNWSKDEIASVVMPKPVPVTGIIIDEQTGAPIAGAKLSLACERCPHPDGYEYRRYSNILAYSDSKGHFEIDSFSKDYTDFYVYVQAPDHQLMSFPIFFGEQAQPLALKRGFYFRGEIRDPQHLLTQSGMAIICTSTCKIGQNGANTGHWQIKRLSLGQPVTAFSFNNLPEGELTLSVGEGKSQEQILLNGKSQLKIPLEKDIDDYVINLGLPNTPCVVEVRFDTGSGQPPPEGSLQVHSLSNLESVPIRGGRAVISVPAPNELTLDTDDLVGYWFREQTIPVKSDAKTLTHTLTCLPAGVIRGKVTTDTKLNDTQFFTDVLVVKSTPGLEGAILNSRVGKLRKKPMELYVTNPLPFGGTYQVVLHNDANFVVSPPIKIDAEHPVVDYNLHRVSGTTVQGRLVDETGKPVVSEYMEVIYEPQSDQRYNSGDLIRTKDDGTFSIPNVNFDVPGIYKIGLGLDPTKWDQTEYSVDRTTVQPLVITVHRKKG